MGKIIGISGPTVTVDSKGLRLYERVTVGTDMLTGEVVKIEQDRSIVQVYEDTRGLGRNEPVQGSGMPLTVELGPGLLSGMFDGLQRPLEKLRDASGPFITRGLDIPALDPLKEWEFHPLRTKGEAVNAHDPVGYVQEGSFKHVISSPAAGKLSWIHKGSIPAGKPIAALEDRREIFCYHAWPVRTPRPYRKKVSPRKPLLTGQRVIDFLFPIAQGGVAMMPGGFGTGKTILEQSIAKFADADIIVYVGCGERGNEMADMLEEFELLKDPWTRHRMMERTLLVINTSNMPVAAREASIYTAVSMAEYYRDMGYHVLLLADSISRWAEALREISSALEEMPGEEGYPTYLASRLSRFVERAGVVETMSGETGALSMILSVSPPGGDFTEPVTQACLRTTGTFLMLDTSLAHRRHFPAINWFQSYSLYAGDLSAYFTEHVSPEWERARKECSDILQKEESLRSVVEIVGIEGIQDPDRLVLHTAEMIRMNFLCQNAYTTDAFSSPEQTLTKVSGILDFYKEASKRLKDGVALDEILKIKDSRVQGFKGPRNNKRDNKS